MKEVIWRLLPSLIRRWWTGRKDVSAYGWHGEYHSWAEAGNDSGGYDDKEIEDKVFRAALEVKSGRAFCERDGVVFHRPEFFEVTRHALETALQKSGKLNVTDFGGGTGSAYFLYSKLLPAMALNAWNVIEQFHIAQRGNKELADDKLRFFSEINEESAGGSDVLLLSSVLQYVEYPEVVLKQLLHYTYSRIIIETTPVTTEPFFITVQRVPPHIYTASYPCHIFNRDRLLSWFPGYKLSAEYISNAVEPRIVAGRWVVWKGFVLEPEKEHNS